MSDVNSTHEAVAVVGMACLFPASSTNTSAYWEVLRDSVDCVVPIPPSRRELRGLAAHGVPALAGLVADIDCFDAAFFRISPAEAQLMDPQQRIFLQNTWAALEDAGCD